MGTHQDVRTPVHIAVLVWNIVSSCSHPNCYQVPHILLNGHQVPASWLTAYISSHEKRLVSNNDSLKITIMIELCFTGGYWIPDLVLDLHELSHLIVQKLLRWVLILYYSWGNQGNESEGNCPWSYSQDEAKRMFKTKLSNSRVYAQPIAHVWFSILFFFHIFFLQVGEPQEMI